MRLTPADWNEIKDKVTEGQQVAIRLEGCPAFYSEYLGTRIEGSEMVLLFAIGEDTAMSEQFLPGAKVRHKSGGPVMAVEGYDMAGRVICCLWDKGPIQRCFTEALLEQVAPAALDQPVERFQPGDKVRLVSGSPHMLVEGYDMAGRVICNYLDRGAPKQHCFTQAVLEIVSSEAENA